MKWDDSVIAEHDLRKLCNAALLALQVLLKEMPPRRAATIVVSLVSALDDSARAEIHRSVLNAALRDDCDQANAEAARANEREAA